jgi:hypothetical protein
MALDKTHSKQQSLREDRGEYTAVLIPEVTREKLHTRQRSDLVSNGNTYSLVAAVDAMYSGVRPSRYQSLGRPFTSSASTSTTPPRWYGGLPQAATSGAPPAPPPRRPRCPPLLQHTTSASCATSTERIPSLPCGVRRAGGRGTLSVNVDRKLALELSHRSTQNGVSLTEEAAGRGRRGWHNGEQRRVRALDGAVAAWHLPFGGHSC